MVFLPHPLRPKPRQERAVERSRWSDLPLSCSLSRPSSLTGLHLGTFFLQCTGVSVVGSGGCCSNLAFVPEMHANARAHGKLFKAYPHCFLCWASAAVQASRWDLMHPCHFLPGACGPFAWLESWEKHTLLFHKGRKGKSATAISPRY